MSCADVTESESSSQFTTDSHNITHPIVVTAKFDSREDFRKQYKGEHPKNKYVAAVGKAGGKKWKSMSDD